MPFDERPRPRPAAALERLEPRASPAVASGLTDGTLAVALSAGGDGVTIGALSDGTVGVTDAATGNTLVYTAADVHAIVVTDTAPGGGDGQSLSLLNGGGAIDLTGAIRAAGIETVSIGQGFNSSDQYAAAGGLAVTGARQVNVAADVKTGGGDVTLVAAVGISLIGARSMPAAGPRRSRPAAPSRPTRPGRT